ncbi:MAG TPA: hypothetical protein VJ183_14065 [Chloroflexia bacterium]|nr:hypothetical protein [Chloroflexia bacterium]
MSDQHMNASDQGSQPDSGSDPNDQVTVDGQGSIRGRAGKGAHPDPTAADREGMGSKPPSNVTEEAHRKGQG